jgi:transposase-like protein
VSDQGMGRRRRRRLSPSEKYEIYVGLLTGDFTQREAADRYGVDRSTIVHAARTAKQGAGRVGVVGAGPAGPVPGDWPEATTSRAGTSSGAVRPG